MKNESTDMNVEIQRLFRGSPTFSDVADKLELWKATWTRAIAKGGTVAELSARIERYNKDETAAARESGEERGRAWAKQQQSNDMAWLEPDTEYVQISLFDLAYALRDPSFDACLCQHTEGFIVGARNYFKEMEGKATSAAPK